jgi:hypothetical protein
MKFPSLATNLVQFADSTAPIRLIVKCLRRAALISNVQDTLNAISGDL